MHEVNGKPVGDMPYPSAEILTGSRDGGPWHANGPPGQAEYGAVVVRWDRTYRVITCSTARYRDEVIVPFYTFYDAYQGMNRFGPDLAVTGTCTHCARDIARVMHPVNPWWWHVPAETFTCNLSGLHVATPAV